MPRGKWTLHPVQISQHAWYAGILLVVASVGLMLTQERHTCPVSSLCIISVSCCLKPPSCFNRTPALMPGILPLVTSFSSVSCLRSHKLQTYTVSFQAFIGIMHLSPTMTLCRLFHNAINTKHCFLSKESLDKNMIYQRSSFIILVDLSPCLSVKVERSSLPYGIQSNSVDLFEQFPGEVRHTVVYIIASTYHHAEK